ncbi:MAG: C1 family peptidase [Methanobacteriota archaeon]
MCGLLCRLSAGILAIVMISGAIFPLANESAGSAVPRDGGEAFGRRMGLLREDPRNSPMLTEVSAERICAAFPGALPASVDNSAGLPPIGDQGHQGSCVAFSVGYYHTTYIENKENPINMKNPANQVSPAFVYNHINGGEDGGAYFGDAANFIMSHGACSMAEMPYNDHECTSWPSDDWKYVNALKRRAAGAYWINVGWSPGIEALKAHLASGNTAVLGIECWDTFFDIEFYNNTYSSADLIGSDWGGHGVCVVGYDDSMETPDGYGAFRIANSWGTYWGDDGYFWMTYEAVMDPRISQLSVIYLESLVDYEPLMVAKATFDHSRRGDVTKSDGLWMALSVDGEEAWSKPFFNASEMEEWMEYIGEDYQAIPFPDGPVVLDLTEAYSELGPPGAENIFYLVAMDSGATGGAITSLQIIDVPDWSGNCTPWGSKEIPPGGFAEVELSLDRTTFKHLPIKIEEYQTMKMKAISEFWQGAGTVDDPYVLSSYDIDGSGWGFCLDVASKKDWVVVENCSFYGASGTGYDPVDTGVLLRNVSRWSLSGSDVSGCDCGVLIIEGCDDNYVINNNVHDNIQYGIFLDITSGNAVYNNNIINNRMQAEDYSGLNRWDDQYPGTYAVPSEEADPITTRTEETQWLVPVHQDSIWAQNNTEDFVRMLAGANYSLAINSTNLQAFDVWVNGYTDANDLDIAVFLDGNNGQPLDGAVQWQEVLSDSSFEFDIFNSSIPLGHYSYCADADANEGIRVLHPVDGTYFVKVLGFDVQTPPGGHFDIRVGTETVEGAILANRNVITGSVNVTKNEICRWKAYREDAIDNNAVYDMDGTEVVTWYFELPCIPMAGTVDLSYYSDSGTPGDASDDFWESFESIGFVEGLDYSIYPDGTVAIFAFDGTAGESLYANFSYLSSIAVPPSGYTVFEEAGALIFDEPLSSHLCNITVMYSYVSVGGGNYWSDYAGEDELSGPAQDQPGCDGFGDWPYIDILGGYGVWDLYPLMEPWGAPPPLPQSYFRVPVVAGWNLISVPLTLAGSSLPAQLLDTDGDTFWDRAARYDPNDAADRWKQYYDAWPVSFNDFTCVDCAAGFWINVTDVGDGYINLSGTVPVSTHVTLRAGWNLVGYPTLNPSVIAADAFWGTGVYTVETFDPGETYLTSAVGPGHVMTPGRGYWVHVAADTVWTVDW